ncbi:MAG: dihydrofolate reductase family protein [Aggregatilineales bacterium]
MSETRNLIYYVATTVDHYIAHEDGSVEGFLPEGAHIADYTNSLRDYETVIMGKHTYEFGYQYGMQPGDAPYPHMMHYIFSQSMDMIDTENVKVIREDAVAFVTDLKLQPGGDVYLCGGGTFAGTLLDAGLIDGLILKVNPVIFGSGIPLFGDSTKTANLHLTASKTYTNGVMFQHYDVQT